MVMSSVTDAGRARRFRARQRDRGLRVAGDRVALHVLADVLSRGRDARSELVAVQFFLLAPYAAVESMRCSRG
jgi:hypothetical protein